MASPPPNTGNVGILAAGLYPNLAALRAAPPPLVQRFARVLGLPKLYRFVPGDLSTDDGWTALVPSLGGGAWLDAPEQDRGADISTANGYATSGTWTIGAYGGPWRVIPAGMLSGNVTATLDNKNLDGVQLRDGEDIFITRLDAMGNTIAWVNGGTGGGTICTMPAGSQAWLWAKFSNGAWVKRASGVMI